MKIQSLSVVVPAKKCINSCKFCVSCMKEEDYKNQIDDNSPFFDLYQNDYIQRLEFARDNGCNTVMLTGNCEPQQNRDFLKNFGNWNRMLKNPFKIIEMQTTGVLLDEAYLRFLRNHVGVKTISLSIASFCNSENTAICGMKSDVTIHALCKSIKKYDFNLRLSLNMNKSIFIYQDTIEELFKVCKEEYYADQVTIRKLYTSENDTSQDKWILDNKVDETIFKDINTFVKTNGTPLEKLEYGAIKYSLYGMGIVIDEDCMSKDVTDTMKYLILRPDCHLYSKWDDKGSLIF